MSNNDVTSLLPERVRNVNLYDPLRKPVTYDLSDNTSQWGMAPGVRDLITSLANDPAVHLSRYPEIYGASVKQQLARNYEEYLGDNPLDNIVVGCGTDDVLDCIIRACTQAGETIINPMPSFPMAGYFAQYNDRNVVGIELEADGSIDVDKFLAVPSKLIYLCSPNNPTGLPISRARIDELVNRYEGFIVIDEAYAEFAQNNCLDLLKENPRIVILRTFSKLHALAGLRIGYGLGNREVIVAAEALRGPYKANAIALAAAHDSLTQKTWLSSVVQQVREQREWFLGELFELGFAPLASDVNFVFIPMEVSGQLAQAFARAEIAVRIFDDLALYGSGIRVTIAPREVLTKVLDVLRSEQS
ncbi:MAG TPA: histidinol-phosphate transaminase [Acidimicrobiia bacterium]|nr:histidinol-phosphate transaminase [Acidimicrobiia bacterium]